MLKILGRKNSSNVQKVLWCCDELGIPFKREDYGGEFGKNNDAEYLALNPNGRIPTIVDEDFVLWESNSIIRYLANKHDSGTRYPRDPEERARGERWMDWQLSVLRETTHEMFWGLVRTKPEDRDYEAIAASRQQSADAFAILDRYLGETDYAAGSRFTICDIPIGIFAHRWFGLDIEREEFPNLLRWYNELGERSAYKKHVKVPLT
ncbi:MAG: glutathione S-transferase family protein [Rhizobiaceae bacterium]